MSKGRRIKERRKFLNISQTDLAKRIHISKQSLYKYENGIVTNIPSDVRGNIFNRKEHRFNRFQCLNLVLFL